MKKVAFIITNLGMGGAENMLVEQVRYMNKEKFEIFVITITPNPQRNVVSSLPPDIKYVPFNFSSIFDALSLFKLTLFLRKNKIYAVITGLFNANLMGRIAAILARVPVILSYEHNVYPDKKKWQIFTDRILSRFNTKIIGGSKEVLEFTAKQQKLPKDKFQLNYNSISLGLSGVKKNRPAVLAKYDLPENLDYIVTAGSLNPQKDHTHLIDAVVEMKRNGVNNFKVLIFGKGPLREELTEKIERSGLADEIKLMGIAPVEDIMAIADIFTLPSLWEGLSIALLQAMDAHCPVVATRVSGTVEALENEVSALIVEPGDSSQLAQALSRMLGDLDLRERMAKKADEEVKRFSIEKNVKVIENLL